MLVVFEAMSAGSVAVVDSDVLYRFRVQLFSLAAEQGVSAACRVFGIHRSTYYRWRGPVLRSGLEMLRPRERRPPRMPHQLSQLVEQRILAFSIAHPGLGPRRVAATLAQERWGGLRVSPNGVWRVLRSHGLSRRMGRLGHLEVGQPGALVGFDCFHIGRLAGSAGRVRQYTAIDLATSYIWAELATTPLNPSARKTSQLARRVAAKAGRPGLAPGAGAQPQRLGVPFRRVRLDDPQAGRDPDLHPRWWPATNRAVERVQRTILEECWRPAFARSLVPKLTGLERDLAGYLRYYTEERAHTGRLTRGRPPSRRSSEHAR